MSFIIEEAHKSEKLFYYILHVAERGNFHEAFVPEIIEAFSYCRGITLL